MRIERQVLFWGIALIVVILLVGMLQDILLPFVAGLAVAYILNPLVDALTRTGLPRAIASALVIVGVGTMGVALIAVLAPLLFDQAQQLAAALPDEIARLETAIEAWAREQLGPRFSDFEAGLASAAQSLAENWAGLARWAATSLWDRGLAIFYLLSLVLVAPLIAFYLLVDWPAIINKTDRWLPRDHAPTIRILARDMNLAISAFVRGQGTISVFLGCFYAAALSLIGLPYGLLIGIATGVLTFVPLVGWTAGLITASLIAAVHFWPDAWPVAGVIAVFLAGQALDSGFLSPTIVGTRVGLHPVWLIFSLFVFGYLFGVVGALVAVPLAAAIGVLVRFALGLYLESDVYRGRAGLT